jgi:hypothetical protein
VKILNRLSMLPSFLVCALTVAIFGSSSPVIAGQARAAAKHVPIELLRDENGDPIRTSDATYTSENWSGYVLPKFQTKQHYTAAQATWTVPTVTYQGVPALSASWIGIGGFCKTAKCKKGQVDKTLIQLGTAQQTVSSSETDYWAWYEMLPAASIPTTLVVSPGDVITASLSCAGKCTGKQKWTLSMTDATTSQSWSQVFTYKSPKLSVEVIEEAPTSVGGILPLADFGTETFSDITADSADVNLSEGDSLIMEDPQGQSSNVSVPSSAGDGFNACFSPDSTLATCVSP